MSQPITLPRGDSVQLTYWSDFANDANDSGPVEVAIDGCGVLEWQVVDSVGRNERDRDVMASRKSRPSSNVPVFEQRRVDLTLDRSAHLLAGEPAGSAAHAGYAER